MIFRQVFDSVFALEVAIAAGVFAIVGALLTFSLIRRRAGAARSPSSRATNTALEASYVVLLTAIAAFLVVVTARGNHREQQVQAEAQGSPDVVRVDVTAYRWCWQFHHESTPVTVTDTCRGPAARPTLVVPAGRPVELVLRSQDVIHALWVPDLAMKRDVFPTYTNTISFTLDREGQWLGRCSEYCGTYHPSMDFYLKAVSPQDYQRYIASGGTAA